MNEVNLVRLCQDVMTRSVVLSQLAFVRRLFKCVPTTMDPISRGILKENTTKLYAFLVAMSSHPMRVALFHAMERMFLSLVRVTKDDIVDVLKKFNREYDLELNEDAISDIIESSRCPYSVYHEHVLQNTRRSKGIGAVKVILIVESDPRYLMSRGVTFKLNVPFRSVRNTMYVDITGHLGNTTRDTTMVSVPRNSPNRLINIPGKDIFGVGTPIGRALTEYCEMWTPKEKFLSHVYSKYTQHTCFSYFTCDGEYGMG